MVDDLERLCVGIYVCPLMLVTQGLCPWQFVTNNQHNSHVIGDNSWIILRIVVLCCISLTKHCIPLYSPIVV